MTNGIKNHAIETPSNEGVLKVVERVVALVVGVFIVGLISYLVLSNKPVTAIAEGWVKTLLALSVAVLAGTLSGEIHINGRVPGLKMRAGGAIAIFVLIFIGLPAASKVWVSPQASLAFAPLASIDLRSFDDPATPKGGSGSGIVAITLRVTASATSPFGPDQVQPALITYARLSLVIEDVEQSLPWLWFVTHDDRQLEESTWLSTTVPIDTGQIAVHPSGGKFAKEILFATDASAPTWRRFVEEFANGKCIDAVKVTFTTLQGGKLQQVASGCKVACPERVETRFRRPNPTEKVTPRISRNCGAEMQ